MKFLFMKEIRTYKKHRTKVRTRLETALISYVLRQKETTVFKALFDWLCSARKVKYTDFTWSIFLSFFLTDFEKPSSYLFSSPEPKAHWWAYRIGRPPSSRRPSSVRRPRSLNIFSETAWPVKVKFHMEPLWDWGTKVCSKDPGHMTKMTAMPIYGKNLRNQRADDLETLYAALGAQVLPSLFKWWFWVDLFFKVKCGP